MKNPSLAWLIQNLSFIRHTIDREPDKAKAGCDGIIEILQEILQGRRRREDAGSQNRQA